MMRVVKIGGRAQSDARLPAALAAAATPAGALVVVHGGGDEVSTLQRRLGLEPTFHGGRRVTSEADLEIVRMVLSGATNKRLVAQLLSVGVNAVGISGEDGGLFRARATEPATMGRVGGTVTVDPTVVRVLLSAGITPVVSPLARDAESDDGAGLNVNGDDAAAALAGALGAEELVLVADVPGVLEAGAVVRRLDAAACADLIARGIAAGGMAAKLDAALTALRNGVRDVRIADLTGIADPESGTRIQLSSLSEQGTP
jgi:acetylglutamate kinase